MLNAYVLMLSVKCLLCGGYVIPVRRSCGIRIRLRLACRPQARALFKPIAAILRAAASAFLGSTAGST